MSADERRQARLASFRDSSCISFMAARDFMQTETCTTGPPAAALTLINGQRLLQPGGGGQRSRRCVCQLLGSSLDGAACLICPLLSFQWKFLPSVCFQLMKFNIGESEKRKPLSHSELTSADAFAGQRRFGTTSKSLISSVGPIFI